MIEVVPIGVHYTRASARGKWKLSTVVLAYTDCSVAEMEMCLSLPFLTIPEVTGTVETICLDCRVTLVPIETFQA